ncbi:ABC transporter permease [Planctomyces sp. SH-PL62]|uniref:ABC transporter permease n=1 Tax=Planctomyces sp. SH-PL62 TaxID=1636152 RepID=UPI00078C0485|nr:ABC transporter permease subunit [Planctomyces sp. SH-PL62]AMV38933.1 ABC-2 family transporter protein [Planctomyces sp. SH-PL62]
MRHVPTLLARELGAYFLGPTAFLVLLGFQVVAFLNFWELVESLARPQIEFSSLRDPMSAYISGSTPFWFAILVAVPLLTMRLLAEENRSGTIETLVTLPITEGEIVVSKWLAGVVMYLVLLVPFALYLPFLYYQGKYEFDVGPLLSLGVGLTTMGMMFVAIGLLFSSLTRNQVVAAVWTFVTLFVLVVMTLLLVDFLSARRMSGWANAARHVAVLHQIHGFALGRFDVRTIALHLSACIFLLYATTMLLAARRGR